MSNKKNNKKSEGATKSEVFAAQFSEVRKLSKKELLTSGGNRQAGSATYTAPTTSSTWLGYDNDNTGGDVRGEL